MNDVKSTKSKTSMRNGRATAERRDAPITWLPLKQSSGFDPGKPNGTPMRFDVLTLFPGIFDGYLREALPRWAAADGLAQFHLHDFRKYVDQSAAVPSDDIGALGPGKKLPAKPVMRCVTEVLSQAPGGHLVMLSPAGRKLRQGVVKELAEHSRLVLLCGRFGGFDDRIREVLKPDEISIGDYVLSGGETAAMVLIDAVLRLVPGVLPIKREPVSPVAGKQNKEEASPPLGNSLATSLSPTP